MRSETVVRVRDAILLFLCMGMQLITFALCIHVLVGPTPQWKVGTNLLRLHHTSSGSNLLDFYLGPLGACLVYSDGRVWCQSPSLTPNVAEVLAAAGIPESVVPQSSVTAAWAVGFPLSQPDLPGVTLFTIIVTFLSICLIVPTALARTLSPYSNLREKSQLWAYWPTRIGVVTNVLGLIFCITIAACFQLQMDFASQHFNTAAQSSSIAWTASVGNAMSFLWATVPLTIFAVLAHIGLVATLPDPSYKSTQWA